MRIGWLAKKAQCSIGLIRFYEQQGLLPTPSRNGSNYRIYTDEHLQRLLLIRRCRGLNMSQNEIQRLLGLMDQPQTSCSEMSQLLEAHIHEISDQINTLQLLQAQLTELRAQCHRASDVEHCGIYHELTGGAISHQPSH